MTRATTFSPTQVTQIASSVAAIASGLSGTRIGSPTRRMLRAAIRSTVLEPLAATHTSFPRTVTPAGRAPMETVARFSVSGWYRTSWF